MPILTGTTEQERTDEFEDLCGGYKRAFRILHIWQHEAWPSGRAHTPGQRRESQEAAFRKIAKREGFTEEQIDAFFEL